MVILRLDWSVCEYSKIKNFSCSLCNEFWRKLSFLHTLFLNFKLRSLSCYIFNFSCSETNISVGTCFRGQTWLLLHLKGYALLLYGTLQRENVGWV